MITPVKIVADSDLIFSAWIGVPCAQALFKLHQLSCCAQARLLKAKTLHISRVVPA